MSRLTLNEAARALLLVLYEGAHHDDAEWSIELFRVNNFFEPKLGLGFSIKVVNFLKQQGLVDVEEDPYDHTPDPNEYVSISATGIQHVEERLKENTSNFRELHSQIKFHDSEKRGHAVTPVFPIMHNPSSNDLVPASDRVVAINHNSPETKELIEAIQDANETIRSANEWDNELTNKNLLRTNLEIGLKLMQEDSRAFLSTLIELISKPLRKALAAVAEKFAKEKIERALSLFEELFK